MKPAWPQRPTHVRRCEKQCPRRPPGDQPLPYPPGPRSLTDRHGRSGPPAGARRLHPRRHQSHPRRLLHSPGPGHPRGVGPLDPAERDGIASILRTILSAPDLAAEFLALADGSR
ncbi:hypothetical protein OG488_00845 [Streptomyces sp. NBC_01460]|uniref:hypothetical protein n=1 Tax=Streptomyces sp. NBC_01460 TaxID=2903875 RepID=UPI002E33AED6|nr:hypothetical protein [Streptomyces sp. NBC_01460]